jgi:hypothetical protein
VSLVPSGGQVWGAGAGRINQPAAADPAPQRGGSGGRWSSDQEFPTLHGKENDVPENRDADRSGSGSLDLRPGPSTFGLSVHLFPASCWPMVPCSTDRRCCRLWRRRRRALSRTV